MQGYIRFERVCEAFINATDEQREKALELLSEEQRQTFLQGVAQYRYLTEPRRYDEAVQIMAQSYYENARQTP